MLRLIYRMLWWLAAPVAVLRLMIRSRREHGYIEHIGERFGRSPGRPADDPAPLIWVHAVSVGETRAAEPLIDALMRARPHARILLTHMTPSGRATGEELFGDRLLRCYLPYDMPHAVRAFLRAWRPALGVVMETEVWPTLIDECRRAGVPLVLANARMSERSYRRAARFGSAGKEVFGGFTQVLAQSPGDAERLNALGARQAVALGNLKFDMALPGAIVERGRAWRRAVGARPVWVAASTREGEEIQVLDALHELGRRDVLLILVPRHPQRFDAIAALLERTGWRFARRSTWAPAAVNGANGANGANGSGGSNGSASANGRTSTAPAGGSDGASGAGDANEIPPLSPDIQVLLGDSMGEMAAYYAAADVAFIGGSLLPLGGQNLIEACALGVPVLIGPHTFNFTQATADAIAVGAALRVTNAATLGTGVRELLGDRSRRAAMSGAAAAFAARHRGATTRTVDVLTTLLPD